MQLFFALWSGRRYGRRTPGLLIICLYFAVSNNATAEQALVFGLLPVESPVALFKRFAPLRDYLVDQVHETIVLETARDFPEYARRTAARRYDIAFIAPHMVLPALDSGHYELAATFIKPLRSVIVVAETSPIKTLQDLAGKRVATPPPQAIVTRVGIDYLQQQGVLEHETTRLSTYRSHNAAYSAVLAGEADAAMIANFIYQKARKLKLPLRQVGESKAFPGMAILLTTDLPEPTRAAIKQAFIGMIHRPRGRSLLKAISQPGYQEADVAQFQVLRPFAGNDKHTNEAELTP